MKNLKTILVAFALGLLTLTSCQKADDAPVPLTSTTNKTVSPVDTVTTKIVHVTITKLTASNFDQLPDIQTNGLITPYSGLHSNSAYTYPWLFSVVLESSDTLNIELHDAMDGTYWELRVLNDDVEGYSLDTGNGIANLDLYWYESIQYSHNYTFVNNFNKTDWLTPGLAEWINNQ